MCVLAGDILVQQNKAFWRKHKTCGGLRGSVGLKLNPDSVITGPEDFCTLLFVLFQRFRVCFASDPWELRYVCATPRDRLYIVCHLTGASRSRLFSGCSPLSHTYDLLHGDICSRSACSSSSSYCFAVLGIFLGGPPQVPVDHSQWHHAGCEVRLQP